MIVFMTDACYNMDIDGILLQEVFRMDNKSGIEKLNDNLLEKVSGGLSLGQSRCPCCHSQNLSLYFGPNGPYCICNVCGKESTQEELV